MFEVEVKFPRVRLDISVVNTEANRLANAAQESLVNYTKLALASYGKIATGGTLRGVRKGAASNRPQAVFGVASHGTFRRAVIAPKAFYFIVSGRRAGAKMPPLQALIPWFNALGIPETAWFPILRAISVRGIRPRNVPLRARRMAARSIYNESVISAQRIAQGIIKVNAR